VRDFAIGKHEVSFAEYDRFARSTGRGLPRDNGWGRGKQPVINVTWKDAQAYARWLSKKTGKLYRLPSEAEWEYAAKGGKTSQYWWGLNMQQNKAVCYNCGSKWDGRKPAPVGSLEENPYGLYHTTGNVSEWVEDCYRKSYRNAPDDGSAVTEPDCTNRVVRSGNYEKPADSVRVTYRQSVDAGKRSLSTGFRVVRDL